jgi:hypothetical protein
MPNYRKSEGARINRLWIAAMPPTNRQVNNIDRLKILPRCILVAVPSYRFFILRPLWQLPGGSRTAGADDDEALAFGEAIIQDLQDGDAMPYAGGIMYITESARLHASSNVRSPTYIFR